MEPRRPVDPFRPAPFEPMPLRPPPGRVTPMGDELARLLKEILDRLTSIETRLKRIEEQVKSK